LVDTPTARTITAQINAMLRPALAVKEKEVQRIKTLGFVPWVENRLG
jgi:hypothetical protein